MRLIFLYLLFINSCNTSSHEILKLTISKLLEKQILELKDSVLYLNHQNLIQEMPDSVLIGSKSIKIQKTNRSDLIPCLYLKISNVNDIAKVDFTVNEKGGYKYKGEIVFKLKDKNYIFQDIKFMSEIE